MMPRTLPVLAVAAACALAGAARAEVLDGCGPQAEIARSLAEGYDERPVAHGLQQDGTLLEVFATERGETFTVVIAGPTGTGCIVALGTSWEGTPPRDALAETRATSPQPLLLAAPRR